MTTTTDEPKMFGAGDAPSAVVHPRHYNQHPSGIECITIVQHMGFCLGNVVKCVWRADHKGQDLQDLEKARYYLDIEIGRRLKAAASKEIAATEPGKIFAPVMDLFDGDDFGGIEKLGPRNAHARLRSNGALLREHLPKTAAWLKHLSEQP